MEALLTSAFLTLLDFMGVSPGGLFVAAIVLGFVVFFNRKTNRRLKEQDEKIEKQDQKFDTLYNLVRKVENEQSAQNRRITDHADFFDVIRADVERSLKISTSSNEQSTEAVKMIISRLKS